MTLRTVSEDEKALELREDRRLLGRLLGEVIEEQAGAGREASPMRSTSRTSARGVDSPID